MIRKLTNREPDFYALLGPFLARREVYAELGHPLWDEDTKVWYVEVQDGQVCGFAALNRLRTHVVLCSAYVLPDQRHRGIYRRLLAARVQDAGPGVELRAIATAASKVALEQFGFSAVRQRGRYFEMVREAQQ
jgi:N-acetylglutamate synthase-like GNAT family acetyltransferase